MRNIDNIPAEESEPEEQNVKNDILKILKRLVPGTTNIERCKTLEFCMDNNIRSCGDIKALCIRCLEEERVIGGLAFPFGIKLGKNVKNPIMIYRYGQSENYVTAIKGDSFDNILEKFENEPVINEITQKTKFIRDEKREFENNQKIEAFKRSDADILVIRKNDKGEYENIDKKLMEIAKQKEEETGKKIKIIDESELDRRICLLGIESKRLIKNLEIEAKTMQDADERVFIFVFPGKYKQYEGILAIGSMEDDIIGEDCVKDKLKEDFLNKYKGLHFISTNTFKRGGN